MIKTFVNAWKVADIRKKLLFTAFVILVFRIGSVIPVPFLNIVDEINVGKGNTILTYLSLMTGSAFTYGTIFAMSITPYINASIIMQLLAVAIPALEQAGAVAEGGRRRQKEDRHNHPFRYGWSGSVAVPGILLLPACQRLSDEGCQRRSIHRL